MNVGQHLYELRKNKRLTLAQLAEISGVNQSTIWAIEQNNSSPSVNTLEKLLTGLEVDLLQFFYPKMDIMIRDLLTKPSYYNELRSAWWFYYQLSFGKMRKILDNNLDDHAL